jgi:hypothetical protein
LGDLKKLAPQIADLAQNRRVDWRGYLNVKEFTCDAYRVTAEIMKALGLSEQRYSGVRVAEMGAGCKGKV